MPTRINIKKAIPSIPSTNVKMNPIMKYLLVLVLVILLGFTVMYIVNIVKYSKNLEKFADVVSQEAGTSKTKEFVLLHSSTCGHCKEFMLKWDPIVGNMTNEVSSNVSFAKYEQSTPGAGKYLYNDDGFSINGFPTVVYVENGKMKDSLVGNVPEAELITFIGRNSV